MCSVREIVGHRPYVFNGKKKSCFFIWPEWMNQKKKPHTQKYEKTHSNTILKSPAAGPRRIFNRITLLRDFIIMKQKKTNFYTQEYNFGLEFKFVMYRIIIVIRKEILCIGLSRCPDSPWPREITALYPVSGYTCHSVAVCAPWRPPETVIWIGRPRPRSVSRSRPPLRIPISCPVTKNAREILFSA